MPILIRRYPSESFSSKQATRTTFLGVSVYVIQTWSLRPNALSSVPVSCNKQLCSRLHKYRLLNEPRLEAHLERNHRHEPWGFSVTTVELGTGGRGTTVIVLQGSCSPGGGEPSLSSSTSGSDSQPQPSPLLAAVAVPWFWLLSDITAGLICPCSTISHLQCT